MKGVFPFGLGMGVDEMGVDELGVAWEDLMFW